MIEAGGTNATTTLSLDLLPTILALAGAELPEGLAQQQLPILGELASFLARRDDGCA